MTKKASKTPKASVDISEVPQVAALQAAEQELQVLIEDHKEFYEKFMDLILKRNQLLAEAEAIIREKRVSCGPFKKISETPKINAEKLFEELGDAAFKELGGYTETIVDYKLDRARFLAFLSSGMVPAEVAEACVTTTVTYHKPETYVIP